MQRDVVGVLDNAGKLVVKYDYGTWGEMRRTTGVMAETIGDDNPFCYRGCIRDKETEMYYLRSRYYNPALCRFINSDNTCGEIGGLLTHSPYTYCENDPAAKSDVSGHAPELRTNIAAQHEKEVRDFINRVAGFEHDGKGGGAFSIKSITEEVTITTSDADLHNTIAEKAVEYTFATMGAILGSCVPHTLPIGKFISSSLGSAAIGGISDMIQSEFVNCFTVRPGTYKKVVCQYRRDFKWLWFFPGVEIHTYELRLYPDYYEVWYGYMYSGFGSEITPMQKIGGITRYEYRSQK